MLEAALLHPIEAATVFVVAWFALTVIYIARPAGSVHELRQRVNVALVLALIGLAVLVVFIGLSDGYLHTRAVLGWR